MKGTVADCIKYVKKAETTVPEEDGGYLLEFGAAPMSEQGKRNDLERIRDLVREGKRWVEIVDEVPSALRYSKEIRLYRAALEEKKEKPMEEINLRPWQHRLIETLKGPVKPRRIFWIWSQFSNVGKSTTFRYMIAKSLVSVLRSDGSMNNLAYAYDNQQVIWFNIPKAEMLTQNLLEMLEHVSDTGPILSGKYESMQKWFNSHVCVTANMAPPFDNLPKRIESWELDANGYLIQKAHLERNEEPHVIWEEANA